MKEEMRKIVQVAIKEGIGGLTALCNDVTVWYLASKGWKKLPEIPQPWEEQNESSK